MFICLLMPSFWLWAELGTAVSVKPAKVALRSLCCPLRLKITVLNQFGGSTRAQGFPKGLVFPYGGMQFLGPPKKVECRTIAVGLCRAAGLELTDVSLEPKGPVSHVSW